jgi:hypothetical protein
MCRNQFSPRLTTTVGTDGQAGRCADGQTVRRADGQTGRQADGQIDTVDGCLFHGQMDGCSRQDVTTCKYMVWHGTGKNNGVGSSVAVYSYGTE